MENQFDVVLETEPDEIVAGDFVQWRRDDLPYTNDAYSLLYRAKLPGEADAGFEFGATADGSGFLVALPSATTAKWAPGTYRYEIVVTRIFDGEQIRIGAGEFVIAPALTGGGEIRTHARVMLDRIEALMEGRAKDSVDNYTIGGRSLTKMSVEELRGWRSYYLSEVEQEQRAQRIKDGKKGGASLQVSFRRQ